MKSKLESVSGRRMCPRHGEYHFNGHRVGSICVGAVCPKCLEEGQLIAQQRNQARAIASAANERVARLTHAGVPSAFQSCDFASFRTTDNQPAAYNLMVVEKYVKNFRAVLRKRPVPGIIFSGVPGTGKTHLACAMINALFESGHTSAYVSAPQLLTAMEDARFGRHDLSTSALIARYAKPSLLVIDEYGAHGTKDTDYQALFNIIDARYSSNLPTLLISNLPFRPGSRNAVVGGVLETLIDDRLIERIRGPEGALLSFDWPSLRRGRPSQAVVQA